MNSTRVSDLDTIVPLLHSYKECILQLNQMMDVISDSIEKSDMISVSRVLLAADDIYARMDKLSGHLQVLSKRIKFDMHETRLSPIQKEIEANLRELAERQSACLASLNQSKNDCKAQIAELATHQSLSRAYKRQCTCPTSRFLDSRL